MIPKSLLFLCLLPSLLFSQELLFKNYQTEISTMDPDKGLLYQFSGDSLKLIDMSSLEILENRYIKRPPSKPFVSLRPTWIKNELWLSEKSGGAIYSIQGDSLHRIDRSDIHNWQSDSSIFVKNDTLFKYGGYGYWTASNALSYYDNTSKGWEVLTYKSSDFPIGTHSQKHFLLGDYLYIFGGYEVPAQNRLEAKTSQAVWRFHLKSKEWKFMGLLDIPNFNSYLPIESEGPEDFELISNYHGLLKINLNNNQVAVHSKNPLYFTIDLEGKKPVFKYRGHYYYYDIDNFDLRLKKVTENQFVLKKTEQTPLFVKKISLVYTIGIWVVIILIVSLPLWFIRKLKRKKKTLFISPKAIRFDQKESEISPVEYTILELLLADKPLESAQILNLVYNESLTKSHNEKIKTQTIDGLNLKLSYLFGSQNNYISSEKSMEDKRIRVYQMNLGEILIKLVP